LKSEQIQRVAAAIAEFYRGELSYFPSQNSRF
jgi:hypothetical protein